jgi:hypothetical protein
MTVYLLLVSCRVRGEGRKDKHDQPRDGSWRVIGDWIVVEEAACLY